MFGKYTLFLGQEASTIEFDGETKITPFNMKDELEEGYFDANGTYIWNKKDAEEIRDSWLDSVDWVKVRMKRDWLVGGILDSKDFNKPFVVKLDCLTMRFE
jgi:hypothetical protein